jgi:hypothetical protein
MRPPYSKDLIRETQRVWSAYSGSDISEEAARQIIEGMTGYVDLLHEWSRFAQKTTSEPVPHEVK